MRSVLFAILFLFLKTPWVHADKEAKCLSSFDDYASDSTYGSLISSVVDPDKYVFARFTDQPTRHDFEEEQTFNSLNPLRIESISGRTGPITKKVLEFLFKNKAFLNLFISEQFPEILIDTKAELLKDHQRPTFGNPDWHNDYLISGIKPRTDVKYLLMTLSENMERSNANPQFVSFRSLPVLKDNEKKLNLQPDKTLRKLEPSLHLVRPKDGEFVMYEREGLHRRMPATWKGYRYWIRIRLHGPYVTQSLSDDPSI